MLDIEILRKKLKEDLKRLKLGRAKEDKLLKELNYLANLFIDSYIIKS